MTGERRGRQRIRNIERWKVVRPRPDYLIPKRRRRTQDTQTVIQDYSSDSEVDFEIVQHARQELREEQQQQEQMEEQNEEEAERLESRERPVRERRPPERYGEQSQQQKAAGNSPRERKRRQAAAAKVATPRREQRKLGIQIQQPGYMTPTGWRRERWIARPRAGQGDIGSGEEETD